jgi:hypothetical protein
MITWKPWVGLILLSLFPSGCSAVGDDRGSRCTTTSLASVTQDPLKHAGGRFCGLAFVREHVRTVRILERAADEPSYDIALLITSATRPKLGKLRPGTNAFYLEARVDPQRECFAPPADNGEQCVPFKRPIFFDILRAERREAAELNRYASPATVGTRSPGGQATTRLMRGRAMPMPSGPTTPTASARRRFG